MAMGTQLSHTGGGFAPGIARARPVHALRPSYGLPLGGLLLLSCP